MPFFQNPFPSEFRGNLVLGDRQYSITFSIPAHAGRGNEILQSSGPGPFSFTGNDGSGNPLSILNIQYAFDVNNYYNWAVLSVDVTSGLGGTSGITAAQVVSVLNANIQFQSIFCASLSGNNCVVIRATLPVTRLKFYVQSGQAETVLQFNARAGVEELPTYFARHTIDNRYNFPDCVNQLIQLDPSNNVDAAVINSAVDAKGNSLGYNSSVTQLDWQFLRGRSGIFQFTVNSNSTSASTTSQLVYAAGALVGDLAMKVISELDNSSNLLRQYQIPYTLTSNDLFSPPI